MLHSSLAGVLRVNWPRVAAFYEQRQSAGVIDMGVAHDHGVDILNGDGKRIPVALLFGAPTLYQAAFQHYRVFSGPQQVQGACYLLCRAKKLNGICHRISLYRNSMTSVCVTRALSNT